MRRLDVVAGDVFMAFDSYCRSDDDFARYVVEPDMAALSRYTRRFTFYDEGSGHSFLVQITDQGEHGPPGGRPA